MSIQLYTVMYVMCFKRDCIRGRQSCTDWIAPGGSWWCRRWKRWTRWGTAPGTPRAWPPPGWPDTPPGPAAVWSTQQTHRQNQGMKPLSLAAIYNYKIVDLFNLQFFFGRYGFIGGLAPPSHIQPNLSVCILGLVWMCDEPMFSDYYRVNIIGTAILWPIFDIQVTIAKITISVN